MAMPATRPQMLDIAMRRLRVLRQERTDQEAAYPSRLAEWEANVEAKLIAKIPDMIERLRRFSMECPVPLAYLFQDNYGFNAGFEIQGPPSKPSEDSYEEQRLLRIIDFLGMLDTDELKPEHRRILQGLGASYD